MKKKMLFDGYLNIDLLEVSADKDYEHFVTLMQWPSIRYIIVLISLQGFFN